MFYRSQTRGLTKRIVLHRTVKYVGKGRKSFYAYVAGNDGKEYSITENIYFKTENAIEVIQKGNKISFVPEEGKRKPVATEVKMGVQR